ncbi:MAG: hypothetical protein WBL93_00865 [Lutisporaceae bacterium]
MKSNNYIVGLGLVFLGLAYFLRNFNVSMINTFMILGGLYLLYDYVMRKRQLHLTFGLILTLTGIVMLLADFDMLKFEIDGEIFIFALGLVFLALYFKKGILGFVFPGYILPALAIYSILDSNFNDSYIWPCFFVLLGLAFYLMYFTAFIHKSSWTLIVGTILILFGLVAFVFILGIVSIDMMKTIADYKNYILSAAIVLIGVGFLYKGLRRK